ncbi:hypothetical protein F5X99DRAFT_423941 [Biscogniauxia marginata]|nr:hypothetical protein F5X99DRAFT_423941 [Biscogniauxia marginata]
MTGFRVIIVGGGIVGLSMAHALRLANIDYLLVEQRDTIVDNRVSASLALMPSGARILRQFGLLDAAKSLASPLHGTFHTSGLSEQWRDRNLDHLADALGYRTMLLDQCDLANIMVEALPDRQKKVKTSKTLVAIGRSHSCVAAKFHDGTVEIGSIIIGADGARSTVRSLMSEMESSTVEPEPFTSSYRALYGHSPRPRGLREGEILERHGHGWAIQVLSRGDQSFFIVYEKLRRPIKGRYRFSSNDEEKLAHDYLRMNLDNDVTFGDLWESRYVSKLELLEQGICRSWSLDRVVLVGDSAHKLTPNTGIDVNTAMESAAILANQLRSLLKVHPEPETRFLNRAFAAYQAQRQEPIKYWQRNCEIHLKLLTWESAEHQRLFKELAEAGSRKSGESELSYFLKLFIGAMRQAGKLDYVPL